MADPVVYMRGYTDQPLEFTLAQAMALRDLKAFAELPPTIVSAIREKLATADGFLDSAATHQVLRDSIIDSGVADSVFRVFLNLRAHETSQVLEAVQSIKVRQGPNAPVSIDDAVIDGLKRNLPLFGERYPAIARFAKAERLANLTSDRLDSVEFLCDVRPIFDDARKSIEGLMPYTRMRIVVTDVAGFPRAFEVELTREQVSDLCEKTDKAKDKLNVLFTSAETWMPGGIPNLPLTRPSNNKD